MIDKILNATAFGSVAWIELVWCLVMGGGLLLALYNVFDAKRDLHDLRTSRLNGIAENTVVTSIRGDVCRVVELSAGLAIGLFGAFAQPSPLIPLSTFYWWYRLVLTVGFLVIGFTIVFNTVIIQHHRRTVLAIYKRERGGKS